MSKTFTDYDRADGWQDGGECCPHCEKMYSYGEGHTGPVFTADGRRYKHFMDTDPSGGPYFCPDCYSELDANRKRQENKSIDEYNG